VAHVDNDQIRIRCDSSTKIAFKKVAAEFRDYEEAILAFVKAFNEKPWVFRESTAGKARVR